MITREKLFSIVVSELTQLFGARVLSRQSSPSLLILNSPDFLDSTQAPQYPKLVSF